jgi:quercetin dioxygenase-like cupin family protein
MMITRRLFASCALCAAGGLLATGAEGQPATTSGIIRTTLQQMDGPAEGYATIMTRGDVPAGAFVAWHTHPGIETAIILTGSGTLMIKGQPDQAVKAGDSFQIPVAMPHALQNGNAATSLASTFIVEKGKPLATLVPM